MFKLEVTDPRGKAKSFPLKRGETIIGRRSDVCQLVLKDAKVSGQHARIQCTNGTITIRDLGSSNGTIVNGESLAPEQDLALFDGDEIRIADFGMRVVADDETKGADPASHAAVRESDEFFELKKRIHGRLLERMDLKHVDYSQGGEDALRAEVERTVNSIIEGESLIIPKNVEIAQLKKEVLNDALGLGPLEDLLADESVTEIMVNRCDQVFVERSGKLTLSEKRFFDDEQVLSVIRRIVTRIGRNINESQPLVDARLLDGSRVNAIIPPLALQGPTLTIRKFPMRRLTVDDLVKFGSAPREVFSFLELCVANRLNVIISGGTGSGKTTLLNILSSFIPHDERIVTVEDAAELNLPQEHVVSLEARPANIEGKGEIAIRDLVKNCLRMRPDRIVVGECRGGEALDMLQAMNTGHDGSLTTAHANSPRDVLSRLETMVLMSGMELPVRAIREQISSAINVIVQQSRLADGTRKITYVSEVTGMESDIITLQDIFLFRQSGFDEKGKVVGQFEATGLVPTFVRTLQERGIPVPLEIFQKS